MHRLLVETAELAKDSPELSPGAKRHLAVLRPKDGEEIELFDGRGSWRRFRCQSRGSARLSPCSEICHAERVDDHRPVLFACVTKGSRWDWTVEKSTELGVGLIVPVISERTIVRIPGPERAFKRERWMRIAEEAARQSDAKWLPEIAEPVDFGDSLAMVSGFDCYVGALVSPPPRQFAEALRDRLSIGGRKAVFVGPEGDFAPDELSRLVEVATPVSFGSTILRAETAAIYGVSVLKSFLDVSAC